jgi:hypothetical protein
MIRLLLFACLVLATILVFQSNVATTGYRAQTVIHLAQDDSGNAQAPEPSTSSDSGNRDDSGKPAEDQQ